jgi:cytochrome b pre-mRNA-processing protein 3
MALFSIFRERPEKVAATALYAAIVEQSRRPEYYSGMGVPDTLDGRFDVLVLNASLPMRRLTGAGDRAAKVSQALFNLMFQDLDGSLREMGVGDLIVPKRIKEMGEAFYGRALAYDKALSANDPAALTEALVRNVYRGAPAAGAIALAGYVQEAYRLVGMQTIEALCDGRIHFPNVQSIGPVS